MNDMTITIMELPTEEDEVLMIDEMKKNFEVLGLLLFKKNYYIYLFIYD